MKRLPLLIVLAMASTWCLTGLSAEKNTAALIDDLRSSDSAAQIEAAEALEEKGPGASEAVDALIELLKADSAEVRAHAAEALGAIGAAAKSAAKPLASLARDDDEIVRKEALEALESIRPGTEVMLPILADLLQDANPAVRARVMGALADRGEESVDLLIKALDKEETAYWACLVLTEIGPAAEQAVPALTEILDDDAHGVRREAILALAAIGPAAEPAVDELAALVDDPINGVAAIYALGSIGKVPDDVKTKLIEKVRSGDPIVKTVSAWTLAKLHPEDERFTRRAVKLLVATLKSDNPEARVAAAKALKSLDADPEVVQPIMVEALEKADEETVVMMLDAMASLGPAIVPRLVKALEYEKARPYVCYVLGELGPAAAPATEALADLLSDPNPEAQAEAAYALAAIGPDAASAVPQLTKALDNEGPVRFAASYALGRIGEKAKDAKPALLEQLTSDNESLALVSAWALAHIDPECPTCQEKAMPVLIEGLEDPAVEFRREAASGLCCFGKAAEDAVEQLKQMLKDSDEDVRGAAAAALKAIGQ